MSAATAEIWLHVRTDLCVRGRWIVIEKRLRAHDHTGDSISALRRLLIYKGLLQHSGPPVAAEPFHGDHATTVDTADRGDAGVDGDPVDHHRAGAALSEATAEFGSIERKLSAQHVQERCLGIDVDLMCHAIDGERDHLR